MEKSQLVHFGIIITVLFASANAQESYVYCSPNRVRVSPLTPTKVICYLGDANWDPNKISVDLCSHIVYINVAKLDTTNPFITPKKVSSGLREKVSLLKAKGIKVSVAIGRWDDSNDDEYSRLIGTWQQRHKFVDDALDFVRQAGFDGLELQWQGMYRHPKTGKSSFGTLIRDLHNIFKPKGLLLSAYVSPLECEIGDGYDVPTISQHLDWISVRTHSYHSQWNLITEHVAPMYSRKGDRITTANIDFSITHWIGKGADRKKLIMSIPTFGHIYRLADKKINHLGATSIRLPGERTIPYSKICQNITKRKWTLKRDENDRVGPYAYGGDQWVSFDDARMVRHKSEYIKRRGLGGAVIWSLEFEDFDNVCKCESYPLLKTINRVLRNYPETDLQC